jgi:putative AlgH/UPF0301 family transcriptional regulator
MSTEGPAEQSYKGSLILADPSLRESTFFRSVLLLTEHSRTTGAFGYILNRPIGKKVGDLLGKDVLPGEVRRTIGDTPVFMGGPVSTEHLTFSALGWSEEDGRLQYATHLSAQEAVMHQRASSRTSSRKRPGSPIVLTKPSSTPARPTSSGRTSSASSAPGTSSSPTSRTTFG